MEQKINGKIENYYFSKAIDRRYSESTQHYHPHYEIYYMKEGSCRYFIDDRSFDVEAGDVIFIPKGIIHRTNYTTSLHSRLLINFTEEYIPDNIIDSLTDTRYLYRSREITRHIEDLFNKIEQEYTHPDDYTRSLLYCYTAEIFYLIFRHPGSLEEATTGNELIDSIVRYIKQNYMSDIKLSTVAKMKSVSPEHLSRSFKRETGFGFCEYLLLLRLQKAEYMLKNEPGRSVAEVAYACGFNDSNYFSDKFKRTYGIPPSHMKRQKEK